ncbi:MAG: hypothetical protein ABIS67_15670 [Candidatus Eisenbacteria bacterium]
MSGARHEGMSGDGKDGEATRHDGRPRDAARVYSPGAPVDHPPLAPLLAVLDRLRARNLPHALGASGLLAAL